MGDIKANASIETNLSRVLRKVKLAIDLNDINARFASPESRDKLGNDSWNERGQSKNRKPLREPSSHQPWIFEKVLKDWAEQLGYRNKKILQTKKDQISKLGPGWYNVHEYPKCSTIKQNVGFGTSCRFKSGKECYPGPGTYNLSKVRNTTFTTRPTFNRGHPCRFRDPFPPYYRGISGYNIIDRDDIAMKPKKVVSRRGPYDLFTVKRDESTIISKLKLDKINCSSWPFPLGSTFKTLKNPYVGLMRSNKEMKYYRRKAKSEKSTALSEKKSFVPGPTDYTPYPDKKIKQNYYPFNSNRLRLIHTFERSVLTNPAVGLYNPKFDAFFSRQYSIFRRVRPSLDQYLLQENLNAF